ncbi:hypothetical protein CBR_g26135 [Chara braunii]|uniref:Branched-chain-amino-acid aminotransferase n=1 Tax=Chara braunii TaxID=69332 RepID=A0A388JW77_CHABU|nr:hypothetical protein CBR_g26135 [Chara braunii]|eukprot:GBG61972.1 hypothetical protein CBR_g26135 [Chara braunii]
MAFSDIPDRVEIKKAIFSTLAANGMRDGVHVRLTLSRGKKVTSGMSPAFNQYGPTLIVLAEWKLPVYDNAKGIKLTTASTRRNPPQCVDSKIHHANLINNILAKIEGNSAGTADAIMLDVDGFVAETNATNLFMIKRGRVLTPAADYCTPGITRGTIMQLAMSTGLLIRERRLSLAEFYSADEVFATGTMGEITPVIEIDGRVIHDGKVGKFTQQLRAAFKKLTETEGTALPF